MTRLLLVEGDVLLGAGIALGLRQEDFVVDCVEGARAVEQALQARFYAGALLDLTLPRGEILAVIERLRQYHVAPIIAFTADNLDLDAFSARIHEALRRRATRRRAGGAIFALPYSWG